MIYHGGLGKGAVLLFYVFLFIVFGVFLWLLLSSTHRRGPFGHDPRYYRWDGDDQQPGPGPRGSDPMAILDRRFASGEIDEDEYQGRRKLLKGDK